MKIYDMDVSRVVPSSFNAFQALSDLASLQEQLAERQVAIQRLGAECQRCAHERLGVHEEVEKQRRPGTHCKHT